MNLFDTFFSIEEHIIREYIAAGEHIGIAVRYLFAFGQCQDFDTLLTDWEKKEHHYAKLGYQTISLETFVNADAQDIPQNAFLPKLRQANTAPVYYAQTLRDYLAAFTSAVRKKEPAQLLALSNKYFHLPPEMLPRQKPKETA